MGDLNVIGNFEDYTHKPQAAVDSLIVKTPNLLLKLYKMEKNNDETEPSILDAEKFLKKEITGGFIDLYSGLGFAILSEDVLNVARWDIEYPILLKNQIYGFENGDLKTAKIQDVNDFGTFCMWELGIAENEREAWKKYLTSERAESDKQRYLDSIIIGTL